MNPSTVFLFFIATLFVVFSAAQQQDLPPPPLSDDGAEAEADSASTTTTTTAIPRNWYRAIFNGSNYDTVTFQKGLASQFAYYQYGTWFIQTYPDPPTYDRTNNIFDFQFAFVSTNSTKRDTVFRQYLSDDPNIKDLKKALFELNYVNLYSIVSSDAPVDTTRSPPAQKQWFFMKLSGKPYNRPHLQQCMINALSALAACAIETDPDSPAYDAGINTRSFKFSFIDDNFIKHQDALMSYLKVKPDFGQLYDACFQPSFKISIQELTVTTTPDAYTTPPPTDPNSKNGDDNNNSPLIPGLENWMSFTLIGVGAFVIVGVSFLVILNYCRSQDESEDVVGGNQSRKNVKFNNRKNIGEAAMAYQQADDEMNGTAAKGNEENKNKNNNNNNSNSGERQSQSLQEQT